VLILLAAILIVVALLALIVAWGREIGEEVDAKRLPGPPDRRRRVA
jgi:hypothetical protein